MFRPAAILLDETLPDLDCATVCCALTEQPQTGGIPIVVLTSHDPLPNSLSEAKHPVAETLVKNAFTGYNLVQILHELGIISSRGKVGLH
jgi:CheY-like chemotaxis protein